MKIIYKFIKYFIKIFINVINVKKRSKNGHFWTPRGPPSGPPCFMPPGGHLAGGPKIGDFSEILIEIFDL